MDKDKTEEQLKKDTLKLADKLLKDTISDIKKIFDGEEFLCACYLIKYIETKDNKYYFKFYNLFAKLDEDKKIMVAIYIATYYKKEDKENKNSKIKKREDNKYE